MKAIAMAAVVLLASGDSPRADAAPQSQGSFESATNLVQQLKQFRSALPASPVRGERLVMEQRRAAVYEGLWSLGAAAMPALGAGLADPDPRMRQNVALFLAVASGGWWYPERPRLDIRPSLSSLASALQDDDARVRGLSAQAIGTLGDSGAAAVPGLVRLLKSGVESDRLSACAALASIGPAASGGLPGLRGAVSDESAVVSRCARAAISKIER